MTYAIIDIETTGLNRYKDSINFIGIGLRKDLYTPTSKYLFYDFTNEETFYEELQKFKTICAKLRSKKLKLVWQNGSFDTLFIELKFGIRLPIHEDVMLLGTAFDLAAPHKLKKMAEKYLGIPDWDLTTKEKTSKDFKKVKPYLKKDVKYTGELLSYFMNAMTKEQLFIYRELLKPAYLMYRDVERAGIYFNKTEFKKVKKKYLEEEKEKGAILTEKYDINWNSASQIQEVLFKKEKIPPIKKSQKTGKPSAGADVLKRLAAQGYELPKQLLEYKTSNTVNKMFLNRWGEDSSYDGRIHPSFNLTNVVTGRTSSSNPNLQQVPRLTDLRGLFTAPKGRLLFEADYSQLELRIAADYANDKTMLNVYKNGGDIHTETAKIMAQGKEPTKEDRTKAKPINFGNR